MEHHETASLERDLRRARFVISQRVGVALSGNEAHGPIPIATLERIAQSDAAPTALRWRAYALAAVSDASISAAAALDLLTSACDVGAEDQLRCASGDSAGASDPGEADVGASRTACVRHEMGAIALELGQRKAGERHLRAALRIDPKRASARMLLDLEVHRTSAPSSAASATIVSYAALDRAVELLEAERAASPTELVPWDPPLEEEGAARYGGLVRVGSNSWILRRE